MPHTGSCLCGSVQIKIASSHESQIACHCTDCQITSGSVHSTNILAKQSDVEIKGDSVKNYDSKAASGNTVTRVFCGNCGSALCKSDRRFAIEFCCCISTGTSTTKLFSARIAAHKSKAFGDSMAVQTGTLPDFRKIPFEAELFTKDRWTGLSAIDNAAQKEIM
ncbi:BQ2448_6523 [Microbotryum intermedium]|uniref:BQ2448_6523 protein n=1 Tax=Microbotryum intermedium TaxID=269621 RepID=A0A238FPF9_9BASI|nr:BQ2448_6523 [Microbotryum intermedium]